MVDQQQQSEAGYERLGGKKLGLVDVVAQSVGFMGPVFSAAFIIPLIIGVNAAARGAGTSAPLAVLLAGIGVFALGWIVAQYAKRIHAAGALYDYVSNGLGLDDRHGVRLPLLRGTIILTTGLGVLIGGYVHDNLMPVVFSVEDGLFPIWVWDLIFALGLFVVLYFGVQISTRVQLTLALVSVAVVLTYFLSVIVRLGGDNDFGKAFDPNPSPDGFSGHHVRRPVRGADLRGVRDGREPRRGDRRSEAVDPAGGPALGRRGVGLLRHRARTSRWPGSGSTWR